MKLGNQIRELRVKNGLTQFELAEKTGLSERTIQRIENHEVEPSKFSLSRIGNVLNENLNENKQVFQQKQNRILRIAIWVISLLIVAEFLLGILTWREHWWVPLSWFVIALSGLSIPYYRRPKGKYKKTTR